jgi:tripartite-type tricarboxylate transporter receptor subunit TctC
VAGAGPHCPRQLFSLEEDEGNMMVRLQSACLVNASVALVAALLVAAPPCLAEAQDLSAKPIKLVVGLAAGSETDVTARLLAQKMSEGLHTAIDVENRPGEHFIPALRELTGAPADGHTLLFMSTSMLIAQQLHPDYPFDLTTLTPVTQVATGPVIVAASKSFPVNTLGDVIAYAKGNPHRLVFAAGGGTESPAYLAIELLKAKSRIDVAHFAYKGGGAALDDLLRSHVDGVLDGLSVIGPRARAGLLKPLVVTSAKRSAALPDVPTVMEAGISDDRIDRWFGILAPRDTPPAIAKRLRDEVARAAAAPDMVDWLDQQGMEAVASEPEEWGAYLNSEAARYARIIRDIGIKPE